MVEIASFDVSLLSAFFSVGGGVPQSLRTAMIRADPAFQRATNSAVIPPWELRPQEPDKTLGQRAVSRASLINKQDPLFDRQDLDNDSKLLFAAFKALNHLRDIADFAETSRGQQLGTVLDSLFQEKIEELRTFIDGFRTDRLSLELGILRNSIDSLIQLKQVERAPTFFGAVILDDLTNPVPGLATTDRFTISVDNGVAVKNVTITMSDISANTNDYTLSNIVTHVNTELVDEGISTNLAIERHTETSFGLRVNIGFDEKLSLTAATATESEAVYISGFRGAADFGSGFVTKIDNLAADDPTQQYTRQIDSVDAMDRANAVAVDSKGSVYVVGATAGDLGNQQEDPAANDIFLQKFDAAGNLIFTRRLGAPEDGVALDVAVDSNDNVFVAGQVRGALTPTAFGGNLDTFITKFDSTGEEQFTRQASPFANDGALSMSIDANNNIFLAGFTESEIAPGELAAGTGGGKDGFVTKLDNSGNLIYHRQLGGASTTPGATEEIFDAIVASPDGSIWVSGRDNERVFISRYTDADNGARTRNIIGNVENRVITDLAVDNDGSVYGAGFSADSFLGNPVQAKQNGLDGFVFKLPPSGDFQYRTFIGTAADDKVFGIAVNPVTEEAYVTGETAGTLAGETSSGARDSFAVKLNANGSEAWRHQFGGGFDRTGTKIAYDTNGTNILTRFGLPTGIVPPDASDLVTSVTSARDGDYFFVSVGNGRHEQITVGNDDTFGFLAFKLRNAIGSLNKGTARFVDEDLTGRVLRISAFDGNKITLTKGPKDRDGLEAIGFIETNIYGEHNDDGTDNFVETNFGLGFTNDISVANKEKAIEANTLIDFAELTVKKAFRQLKNGPDPKFELPTKMSERTLNQITAMENALVRLQGFTSNQASLLQPPAKRGFF